MTHQLDTSVSERPYRRGAVSIWAILCLVLVTAVGASLGKVALMGSRHMIQERRHSQTAWLVQSGWLLANAQLQRDPDYKGETWDIPATDLGGADGARVKIDVAPPAEGKETREIHIVAEFPAGSDRRVQLSRQGTWQKPKP